VLTAWVLFRAVDFQYAWGYYKAMFGFNKGKTGIYELSKYMDIEFFIVLIIALFASTGYFKKIRARFKTSLNKLQGNKLAVTQTISSVLMVLFYWGILVLCSAYLLSNTYNPFIYYRF
jgi:alginate O-acetyltransferase complex protein AlgI